MRDASFREEDRPYLSNLATREVYRDEYWLNRDPILADRLRWRAQTFRHLVHLAPGQTVLELGSGAGLFTPHLNAVSRGENAITAISFSHAAASCSPKATEVFASLPSADFDYIVVMDLLDERNSAWLLQHVFELLKPGGKAIFYESNPWNPVLRIRRFFGRLRRAPDPRRLLNRYQLYELISEIGFIRIFAIYNDFVYRPLPQRLIWLFRNLSIILENTPLVRALAGSILIHMQKPPRFADGPKPHLAEHSALLGKVSVVIPSHNEGMNVGPLVTDLLAYYAGYIREIILIDDNSRDDTRAEIE